MPAHRLALSLILIVLPLLATCSGQATGAPTSETAATEAPSPEPIESSAAAQPTSTTPPLANLTPLTESEGYRVFTFYGADPTIPVVPHGASDRWDGLFVNPGGVLFHDGEFHMFRNGFKDFPLVSIGHMSSPDGLDWTESQADPVFTSDQVPYIAEGDGVDVSSVVVLDDGTWVMYFHRVSSTNPGEIGRVTAPAPTGPWEVDPEPVLLPGGEGAWDAGGLEWPSVQNTPEGLVMYYSGRPTNLGRPMIGRAVSQDGIEWEKYDDPSTTEALYAESDPVFAAEEPWTTDGVDRPRVQLTPEGWVMVYQGGELIKRGLAFSADGINWVRHPENPVLELEDFPFSGTMWETNLLYLDGIYYYYTELGSMAGTDIYLAVHEGKIIPTGLDLPEPVPVVIPLEPAVELPDGVVLLGARSLLVAPGDEPTFTTHLNTNIISLGTYSLGAGTDDQQTPHNEDEVYYVMEGEAVLDVGGEKVPVTGGSLVYVHAQSPHHFEEISRDLQTLVFFSKRGPSPNDPAWLGFEVGSLQTEMAGGAAENTFLDAATLDGRLVSLVPGEAAQLDGGSRAVYLVLDGYGNLLMGDSSVEISEGMLLYYPREVPTALQSGEGGLVLLEIAATE